MSIHLGIIPDGNRRYCKKNGCTLLEMVQDCFESHLLNALDYIYKLTYSNKMSGHKKKIFDITEVSFYMLSADNLKQRTPSDIKGVFTFFNKVYEYLMGCVGGTDLDERTKNHALLLNKINIQFVGELSLLPQDIKQKIDTVHTTFNKKSKSLKITIAIAYDPVKDLERIINSKTRSPQSPIDVIIRTSGEKRLSGFFPYHSLYSELVFVDKLWPEFGIDDLEDSLAIYCARERRFGK